MKSKRAKAIRKKFKLWFDPTASMCYECGDHNPLHRKKCKNCGTSIKEEDGCAYLGKCFGGCNYASLIPG